MRKSLPLIAALFLGAWLLPPRVSHATAPSLVEPIYEPDTRTLSVKIRHWSLLDRLHYTKFVEVKVNGTLQSTNEYEKQPDNEYTYRYDLLAGPGDVIEVTAKCNLWGSRTVELRIP